MHFILLKAKIKEKFGNQDNFAKILNMSPTNLNNKLNKKNKMTQNDILNFCNLLEINKEEIPKYFF